MAARYAATAPAALPDVGTRTHWGASTTLRGAGIADAAAARAGGATVGGMTGNSVLVVDDDAFARTLLASTLTQLGFRVVADVATVATAMEAAREHQPAAALLDLDLGEGPTGIDLAHGLRRLNPRIGIVMLTSYEEPRFIGSNRLPPAGSRYVVKRHLQDVADLADELSLAMSSAASGVSADLPRTEQPLSPAMLEVMRLVAAGYANAEIARRQHLTEASVAKAVARIIKQLGIQAGAEQNQRVLIADAYRRLVGAPGTIRG